MLITAVCLCVCRWVGALVPWHACEDQRTTWRGSGLFPPESHTIGDGRTRVNSGDAVPGALAVPARMKLKPW